jgi:hypothetical protein
MKKKPIEHNPYATVRGGKIEAPNKAQDEPKATCQKGSDLRVKR